MNPEIKAQWLEALRSGDYQQGFGYLHRTDEDSYCCLGVLCDLAVKAGVVETNPSERYHYTYFGPEGRVEQEAVLPDEVRDWADLDTNLGYYGETGDGMGPLGLPDLNDSHDWDFNQIADLIERVL